MNEEIPETRTTLTGLKYCVTQVGHGKDKPEKGDMVKVHYTGRFENGTVFDTSVHKSGNGKPLEFLIGMGKVIKGWDEGIADMVVGEKRTLTVPPHLAYGDHSPPSIPPNSTLIFDVERLD